MSEREPVCDLQLVVEIVQRAGLVCELVRRPDAHPVVRARPRASGSTAWTVRAGLCSAGSRRPAEAFVGPADSPQRLLLREPDERRLAALVIVQALHPAPSTVVSCDEVEALGLSGAALCTS